MKKLLMLGTSFGSVDIIQCARRMGVYTIVTDYNMPEKSKAKPYADEYWMIGTDKLDELEQRCRQEHIDAVISGSSDFNCGQAIQLCERLSLPCYCDYSTWKYSVNKLKFKEVCKQEGVRVADDYYLSDKLDEKELDNIEFPVVVKPIDQCGNVGVGYCYNREQLIQNYRYAQSVTENKHIIVERMLRGQEYNVYYAMADGEIHLINAATEHHQHGYPANLYSIITSISSHIEQFNDEINEKIIKMLKRIGCRDGLGWVELILDQDGKFYVIEMGYRFGSDMMCSVFEQIYPFEGTKWMIECALGIQHEKKQLPPSQTRAFRKCVCSYGFFSLEEGVIGEIEGLKEIYTIPGLKVDFIRDIGDKVSKYSLIGEVIFSADDSEKVIEILKKINKVLKIRNTEKENMMIYFTDYLSLKEMYRDGLKG